MKWKEKAASNYLDTYPYIIPGEGKKVKLKSHWKTETKIYEGNTCPHAQFSKIILIPLSVFKLIRDLEKETSNEYLIYLEVEEQDDVIILKNPFIPKQKVSSASVDVEESFTPESPTAVIHRHPKGVKSFSATDYEYINRNNYLSLLWVDGQFSEATIKKKLPCGAYMMVEFKPEVYINYEEDWLEKYNQLKVEAKEKIKRETYYYKYSYPVYDYYTRDKVKDPDNFRVSRVYSYPDIESGDYDDYEEYDDIPTDDKRTNKKIDWATEFIDEEDDFFV